MTLAIVIISALLVASLALNVHFYLAWKRAMKAPTQTTELQEFLGDLFTGKLGMIAVARVDQSQLLIRSPKGS